ncbi:glutathione S-transferase N-terminal domain-containing protein [Asaia siamensis]|uniref:Glutathione S-transferase n=1 Tax=Asaia siamensis TaxID=110479 RepID=A0ABQ1M014_9PROT|nr:glutathione binding-like protein [Asaia siamensis]GBR10079.1 glutathione S-transferase [Asaia siamensis NRIC 0323]GGC32531.1 glutathione S-transferase [Asaia siamensis]
MIDLYYWPTPNGHKITLFLEEAGLDYRIIPVDIGKGDQFKPDFLKISPNNKMPAIVDHEPADGGAPLSVFESGEILLYLAEKTGRFLSSDPRKKIATLEWLFWQMGGFGPMLGQNHHFALYAPEKIPYVIKRYQDETKRLYGVLETRLKAQPFVSGDEYGIADMATYPWTRTWKEQGINLNSFPMIKAWREAIEGRPPTQRALAKAEEVKR